MANIARARVGDLVKCKIDNFVFIGEVIGEPERVSPRVFEVPVRVSGGGYWLRDAPSSYQRPVGPMGSIERVRGRAVQTLYRQLKS